MTTEFDLIRRYRGAFSEEECKKFIDFIEDLTFVLKGTKIMQIIEKEGFLDCN